VAIKEIRNVVVGCSCLSKM